MIWGLSEVYLKFLEKDFRCLPEKEGVIFKAVFPMRLENKTLKNDSEFKAESWDSTNEYEVSQMQILFGQLGGSFK